MKNLSKKQRIQLGVGALLILLLVVYMILSFTYKYPFNVHHKPNIIDPFFIQTEWFEIRWYAICILGGACLVALYGYYCYLKKVGLDSDSTLTGLTLGLVFGILGGRLYYVLFEHSGISFDEGVLKGILSIINPASGGIAIHGAIYGATLFILVFCIVKKLKFIELIEIVLPVFMLAQVIGRWGNFFNQEAYGPLVNGYTSFPLSDANLIEQRETLRHLLVPDFVIDQMYLRSAVEVDGVITYVQGYYHPTFFYEGIANLIGALTYINIRKRSNKVYTGDAVCFYLTWYGLVRFFIEILRQDPLTFEIFNIEIKVAVLTSVLFFVAGIVLFILRRILKFHLVPCKEFFENGSIYKENAKEKEMIETQENKLVVFDCDGTLLDTYDLVYATSKKVFEEKFPGYPVTHEEIDSFFGPLIDESLRKYAKDEEHLEECLDFYRKTNIELHPKYVKPFTHIKEMLEELKAQGYKIAIVSNKISKHVLLGLQISGIDHLVDEICGAELLKKAKPDPDGIYQMMEKYNVEKAVFVGDTKFDMKCGTNAKEKYPNVVTVGVTWCKTTREEFEQLGADYIIDDALELVEIVGKHA